MAKRSFWAWGMESDEPTAEQMKIAAGEDFLAAGFSGGVQQGGVDVRGEGDDRRLLRSAAQFGYQRRKIETRNAEVEDHGLGRSRGSSFQQRLDR